MNFKIVSYFLGWVLKIEAVSMAIPLLIAICCGESSWVWFLVSIAACLAFGIPMTLKKEDRGSFYAREGYVITALGWILLSLIGALPFFLSGKIPSYLDAVFEIVSGFTTTGSTILYEVEPLGYGLLFWRSFSHWLGGMGVLVLLLSLLPANGGYNMAIMKAESPGPSVSKLVPKVRDTAKYLYLIYSGMTLAAAIMYWISGMPLFDAVCIAFGTAGTGGFAVRNSGMNDYSTFTQVLITIWMILFGVNFNVYFLLVRKKWKDALKCEEMRVYLSLIVVFIAICTFSTCMHQNVTFGYSLHHSAFTVASLITTTGFGTVDFSYWTESCKILVLFIMFCGACAGSTGGGFKVSRLIVIAKEARSELHLLIHPNAVRPVRLEGKVLDRNVVRSVNSYFIIYVFLIVLSVFIVSLDGFDMETNISAVFATFNNIGPGLSRVGPYLNFAEFSPLAKLVLIFDMIAGRLEIIPMLMLVYPKTWRKHF